MESPVTMSVEEHAPALITLWMTVFLLNFGVLGVNMYSVRDKEKTECVLVFWGGFPWLGGEMCVSIYGVVCVESLFDGESENDRRRAGVNVFASSVYVCVCVCVCCAR